MRYESLVSIQNLRLAWRRINTGRNIHYKRFFRDFYLVYETALEQNLKFLRQRLLAQAWIPSHPTRIYLPKPSGLQRPISLLGIEDQILLQAVANSTASKLAKKRRSVEYKGVFSNILSTANDSIFFLQSWQKTYRAFQEECKMLFEAGNPWIAHFDLAAFYDTISHDLLLRIVSPRNKHPKTWNEVGKWLKVWSAPNAQAMTSHGIPQGPIASDFLSEAFFLPIDIALRKAGIKYVRYVDDIRLFGASENEARDAAITLEWFCRDRGLVPQGKKFSISHAGTPKDALGSLPSILPTLADGEMKAMDAKEATRLLGLCVGGRPLRITDKSRFLYVMYRAPKSPQILEKVIRLLPRHPEHIDAIAIYFSNYGKSKRIVRKVIQILSSGVPYAYVRGELWHLLARLCTKGQLVKALDMARQDARERTKSVGLSWGVMNFLIRCQAEGHCGIGSRLSAEIPLSRALLAAKIPLSEFAPKRVVVSMLRGTIEEQLAAARQLQIRKCSLSHLGLRQGNLPPVCQNSLRGLGVIHRVSYAPRDWIAERLYKLYGGQLTNCWHKLLSAEYELALQILIEADAMYDLASSNWLVLQDSFNDAVFRRFIYYLQQQGHPGGNQRTIAKNGELVTYGKLLQANGPVAIAFPKLRANLQTVHSRRSRVPGTHPYDQKGGARNIWLTKHQRDALTSYVRDALSEIASYVVNNP